MLSIEPQHFLSRTPLTPMLYHDVHAAQPGLLPAFDQHTDRPVQPQTASCSVRCALLTPQANPGHAFAAVRALKSGLLATTGAKGPKIRAKSIVAGATRWARAARTRRRRTSQGGGAARSTARTPPCRPVQSKVHVPLFAARTFNPTGQYRVTLSLR